VELNHATTALSERPLHQLSRCPWRKPEVLIPSPCGPGRFQGGAPRPRGSASRYWPGIACASAAHCAMHRAGAENGGLDPQSPSGGPAAFETAPRAREVHLPGGPAMYRYTARGGAAEDGEHDSQSPMGPNRFPGDAPRLRGSSSIRRPALAPDNRKQATSGEGEI
jgi:hypothetical protein